MWTSFFLCCKRLVFSHYVDRDCFLVEWVTDLDLKSCGSIRGKGCPTIMKECRKTCKSDTTPSYITSSWKPIIGLVGRCIIFHPVLRVLIQSYMDPNFIDYAWWRHEKWRWSYHNFTTGTWGSNFHSTLALLEIISGPKLATHKTNKIFTYFQKKKALV